MLISNKITNVLSLLRTSSFRMAALYTCIFGGSVLALFIFVFVTTSIFVDRQIEADIDTEVRAFIEVYESRGIRGLILNIKRRLDDPVFRHRGVYLLINPRRQPLAGNLTAWPKNTQAKELLINFSLTDMRQSEASIVDIRAKQFILADDYRLLVGRDITSRRDLGSLLLRAFYLGLGLTLALGLLGGVIFSRSMSGRIEKITNTCQIIMNGKLSQRIAINSQSDELARLSDAINQMLDQIETLMNGLREVSDNVAHDLRTPLNRLRARLELALKRSSSNADKVDLQEAINEADNLLGTFSSLLRIARAEVVFSRNFERMQLGKIVEDVAELYRPFAEEKGLTFITKIDHKLEAMGDGHLVAQAIANIVDNAVKYSPSGRKVSISLELEDRAPQILVSDEGAGIPESFYEKVFERLFRLDSSRSTPGSGLGLSLVGAVAKSHGLNVILSSNSPGLIVAIRFPVLV